MRPTKRQGCPDRNRYLQVTRRNPIRRIKENIAGGRQAYYSLPFAERVAIHDTAVQLFDLGVDIASAERAEPTDKRGFVYVITNLAWPEYVKIGRAFNPESRLNSYQTSCPQRDYRLYGAVYFEDCHFAEQELHARLRAFREQGEWFRISPFLARHEINKLRSIL